MSCFHDPVYTTRCCQLLAHDTGQGARVPMHEKCQHGASVRSQSNQPALSLDTTGSEDKNDKMRVTRVRQGPASCAEGASSQSTTCYATAASKPAYRTCSVRCVTSPRAVAVKAVRHSTCAHLSATETRGPAVEPAVGAAAEETEAGSRLWQGISCSESSGAVRVLSHS